MAKELVLLIDDREAWCQSIVDRVLSPNDYRSLVAQDLQAGMHQATVANPDLIFLNLERLGPSGIQFLKSLRERGCALPVLLCSSQETENLLPQAFRLGAREYVNEPVIEDEMLAAIDRALRESRLRRERDRLQERLYSQIQEQRELDAIGQVVTSQPDLQQVLNRLVEAAVYVTGADGGLLYLQDADSTVRLRARLDEGQQNASATDCAIQDRSLQSVLESGRSGLLAGPQAAQAEPSASALLDVPLKVQGRSIGLLRVLRLTKQSPFSQDSIRKLSVLVRNATLIIESANLRAEVEAEVERMAICYIGASFGSTLDLDSILETVMDVAVRIVDAERGYIALLDEPSAQYVPRVAHGLTLSALGASEFESGRRAVDRVVAEGRPLLTTTEHVRLDDGSEVVPRAVLCVPILDASGAIGALYVDHLDSGSKFQPDHQAMLTALSTYAAAAIKNARLFDQVKAEGRKLEAVIRGTEQPVIVTDMEGTVLLMNRAAHRAFSTRQIRGTGMLLPRIVEHPSLSGLFGQAKVSGRVEHGEISVHEGKTYSASVTPIPGVGFVTVMQDITEIKELSELKSEFVATVSHDLRSPLSTVLGILNVLGQAGPLNDEQQEFVDIAQQEVMRLIELTRDLLDLGRLEAGIELEMEPCSLRNVVRQSLDAWRVRAEKRQHVFEADLPLEGAFVVGNARRLRQMVDNLLSNAIKYTPPGGRISVHLAQEGAEIALYVRDSGIGIAPEDQPYVFDRFYRVRNEQTQGIEGTGLGLTIVKTIIELHGGRIWLESAPGKGSTVEVVIPAYRT